MALTPSLSEDRSLVFTYFGLVIDDVYPPEITSENDYEKINYLIFICIFIVAHTLNICKDFSH